MPLPLSCSAVICLRRRRGGPLWPPAGFGTGFIPRGGFRPAGRVSFPSIGKKPKDRRGRLTSPSETSSLRLQFVLPRTPVYGGYPYTLMQDFRRAKYGSGYDSFRATGPWCGAKFRPVPFYRRAWFRPAVAEGAGRGTPDEAVPKSYGMNGETSHNGGRAATEGRPYGVFMAPFGSGGTGAVSWLWWPSHRPGPKLLCRGGSPGPPAFRGPLTSIGRDDPARRHPSVDRKNSETRREGQAPPLRDERGNIPQRGTGGHGGLPALREP